MTPQIEQDLEAIENLSQGGVKIADRLRQYIKTLQEDTLTNFRRVEQFHKACESDDVDTPLIRDSRHQRLRLDLIDEERKELEEALEDGNIVAVADALSDLLYVTYGMGLAYGIDLDRCFAEVHRSNMTKFPDGKVLRRADGKVMKPDSWEPPNLHDILFPYPFTEEDWHSILDENDAW